MSDVYSHVYPQAVHRVHAAPLMPHDEDRQGHYHTILTLAQPRGLMRKDLPLLPS